MTEKKDDFTLWAVLGMAGAAVIGLIASSFNKPVNSYQSSASYSPPAPPTSGGCGCSAGR